MVISARVHYACLAMLELALRREDAGPVAAGEITERHGIPGPFLVQILRSLRGAGWVSSIRGSGGGYRLAVDPAQITLLEIAEAVGCAEAGGKQDAATTPADRMLHACWEEAAEAWRQSLSRTRLSDLVEQCRHGDSAMFYI